MTFCIQATWDDVPHLSQEQKDKLWADMPAHQREARTKGIPALGSGAVFTVAEEELRVEPFAIPASWPQIIGVDFGVDHPFAAARMAWDRDQDTLYVTAIFKQQRGNAVTHAAALKPWGAWLPVAWPHDGLQHDKGSGLQLAAQYREQGLAMLQERAAHDDGTNGFEAGLQEMAVRMETGRWKVFSPCVEWFAEYRMYHREKGLVVKKGDDALDASRYAMMMRRHASVKPDGKAWKRPDSRWVA